MIAAVTAVLFHRIFWLYPTFVQFEFCGFFTKTVACNTRWIFILSYKRVRLPKKDNSTPREPEILFRPSRAFIDQTRHHIHGDFCHYYCCSMFLSDISSVIGYILFVYVYNSNTNVIIHYCSYVVFVFIFVEKTRYELFPMDC